MADPRRLQSFHVGHKASATRSAVYVRAPPGSPEARGTGSSASPRTSSVDDADRCLLRNILRCFHFLDFEDRGHISPAEAMAFIAPLKRASPDLFELLCEVLAVTKHALVDGRIGKEPFIRQLESSLGALARDDTSPLAQLRQPCNAISRYFSSLKTAAGECDDNAISSPGRGPGQVRGGDLYDSQAGSGDERPAWCTDFAGTRDEQRTQSDEECTFKPVTNRRRFTAGRSEASVALKDEIRDMHRFQYGRLSDAITAQRLSGNEPRGGMSEYIVFHFSECKEWPQDLRSLRNPSG
ncbi:hypothetical protein, conserved [Babesia bigemina]|uniref:EF-hand domain-containing protein n=1 Tax=Babesia bigemina TaxID=5866 RepID=A0A061BTD2_BABBI|nr:hypothetical protein, conserved [Babesia bigemina]CDR71769.1 hypothetical protein, conserved [Babesia bigemina]|eukprot:XP_012770713.1 hypothetical protein, conserved [Babesia bigemina]